MNDEMFSQEIYFVQLELIKFLIINKLSCIIVICLSNFANKNAIRSSYEELFYRECELPFIKIVHLKKSTK